MTTDLKALADALKDAKKLCAQECQEHEASACERAESLVRTLADADKSMPVVAATDVHSLGPYHYTVDLNVPLVRQSDAQAAILAATERAEKDAKDAERYRWLRDEARCVDWSAWLHRDRFQQAWTTHTRGRADEMDAAIDQHLGAAK
jgi:hypothetical protein